MGVDASASAQVAFGLPVNTLDLVAAAKAFPLYQHSVIALGIIAQRKKKDSLRYNNAKETKHIGDLPEEVTRLVFEYVFDLLLEHYTTPKYGSKSSHNAPAAYCDCGDLAGCTCRRIGTYWWTPRNQDASLVHAQ
jgi:hypothetical protein